jgi:hypothetical protein
MDDQEACCGIQILSENKIAQHDYLLVCRLFDACTTMKSRLTHIVGVDEKRNLKMPVKTRTLHLPEPYYYGVDGLSIWAGRVLLDRQFELPIKIHFTTTTTEPFDQEDYILNQLL